MQEFGMQPAGKQVYVTLAMLVLGLPLVVAAIFLLTSAGQPLAMTSATAIAAPTLLAGVAILLGIRRMRLTLEHGVLVIRATFYTQRVPFADLALDTARILDLDEYPEWRPSIRLNGLSLPGLHAGHYRARAWKQKLFCALTSRQRVLLLPQHSGRALLLSPKNPQALLQALRPAAG